MSEDYRWKSQVEQMRAGYRMFEAALQDGLSRLEEPVSCKAGCHWCCRNLNLVGAVEGFAVASYLVEHRTKDELEVLVPRLRKEALEHGYEGISAANWARQRIFCSLLDPETRTCTVYEGRPSTCRYHFVSSPASVCESDEIRQVRIPDMSELKVLFTETDYRMTRTIRETEPGIFGGPLALVILYSFTRMAEDPSPRYDAHRSLFAGCYRGLLTPVEWWRTFGQGLIRAVKTGDLDGHKTPLMKARDRLKGMGVLR